MLSCYHPRSSHYMRRILYKQPYTSLRSLSSINKQPHTKLKMSNNKGEEQRESRFIAGLSPLGCKHCHLPVLLISHVSPFTSYRTLTCLHTSIYSHDHLNQQNSVFSPTQPRATTPPTSTLSPQSPEVFSRLPPTHTMLGDLMFLMRRSLRV